MLNLKKVEDYLNNIEFMRYASRVTRKGGFKKSMNYRNLNFAVLVFRYRNKLLTFRLKICFIGSMVKSKPISCCCIYYNSN